MVVSEIKTLKIEGMTMNCCDIATSFADDGQMQLVQGNDVIWLDPEGAKALAAFLAQWASEN